MKENRTRIGEILVEAGIVDNIRADHGPPGTETMAWKILLDKS